MTTPTGTVISLDAFRTEKDRLFEISDELDEINARLDQLDHLAEREALGNRAAALDTEANTISAGTWSPNQSGRRRRHTPNPTPPGQGELWGAS